MHLQKIVFSLLHHTMSFLILENFQTVFNSYYLTDIGF